MMNRVIVSGLGALLLLIAPSAFARFPEDFKIPASSISSSSMSSADNEVNEDALKITPTSSSSSSAASAVSTSSSSSEEVMESTVVEVQEEEAEMNIMDTEAVNVPRIVFTAAIVEKLYTQADLDRCFWDIASNVPPTFTLIFTDVHVSDQYAKHVCVAMRDGIIKGYSDGSFRPNRPINMAESAKILSRAFVLAPYSDADRLTPWYQTHVQAVAARNAIPENIKRLDQLLTPLDAAEMIVRMNDGITWRPFRRYEDLIPATPVRRPSVTVRPLPGSTSSVSSVKSAISSAKSVGSVKSNSYSAKSVSSSSVASVSSASSKGSFWNPF